MCYTCGAYGSDVALKQFLVYLDESSGSDPFIIHDLDEKHLFVQDNEKVKRQLLKAIEEWQDENSFVGEDEFLDLDMEEE